MQKGSSRYKKGPQVKRVKLFRILSLNVMTAVLPHEPVPGEAGHLPPEGGHELRLGQAEQEGLGVDSEDSSELIVLNNKEFQC